MSNGQEAVCSATPQVACFKLGAVKGYPVVGSYAATLDTTGLEVDRYDAAHNGKSVFVGRKRSNRKAIWGKP